MPRVHFQIRVGVFICQQIWTKISFVIFDIVWNYASSVVRSWVHKILTTVMARIVVDKGTDDANPCSICSNSRDKSSPDGQRCETKIVRSKSFRALHPWGDNWSRSQSRPRDDDSKLINLGGPRIIFRYFGRHISTFWPASTLTTEGVLQ